MKLVCISDTHSMHHSICDIPDGDVLIHAGDSLGQGTLDNVVELNDWLGTLPHRYKIVIAGNHDWVFQDSPEQAREALSHAIYLEDSGIEIEGVRFWGSPWTPTFWNWAFMLDPGQPLYDAWSRIPDNTDVLITHGPPRGIGDEVALGLGPRNVGCAELMQRIDRLSLKAHVFGHIHEGYGIYQRGPLTLINASTCNAQYQPINPPIVLNLASRI
ncbi:metallophosphatase domain-containing protein [Halopseudomonas yangmingensis]|uniref:Predicted phosphoesterase n=1 Tax=Halopseudomonas yangmingensis TaxID=1720063 RepID=A0A1I4SM13_9GAMM|nr:metallophosphatase domain-containing protein [Halopseudomonas yangmingensis]SFM65390.1 Predicted phosphoesterase [Halopseudomonas yangmingensis]